MNIFKGKKKQSTSPEKQLKIVAKVSLQSNVKSWGDSEKLIELEATETLTCTTDANIKDLRSEIENALADIVAKFDQKFKESPHLTNGYHANLREESQKD